MTVESKLDLYKILIYKEQVGTQNDAKAGLKKSDISDENLRCIFDALDKVNSSGEKDGVLDASEIESFKEKVLKAAHDSCLSEREAKKLLKNLGLNGKDVKPSDLFKLMNLFTKQSKEIIDQRNVKVEVDGKEKEALETTYRKQIEKVFPDGSKLVVKNVKDKYGYPLEATCYYNKEGKLQKEVDKGRFNTRTTNYTYFENGKEKTATAEVTDKMGGVVETLSETYEYNDAGQRISTKTKLEDKQNKQETITEKTFEYNEQGQCIKENTKQTGPKKVLNVITGEYTPRVTNSVIQNEYHENGKLKKRTISGEGKNRTIIEYREDGQIKHKEETKTQLNFVVKQGKIVPENITTTTTFDYEYYENGKKKSYTYKSIDNNGHPTGTIIEYNTDGTIKSNTRDYYKRGSRVEERYEGANIASKNRVPNECVEYEADGVTIKRRTVNEFDKDGILVGQKVFDKDNNVIREHDFSEVNGEFEVANQKSRGDCYLLAAINALSQTEDGHSILKNNLKIETDEKTGKKTYTITFPGAKELKQKLINGTAGLGNALPADKVYIQESYTITEDELKQAAKNAGKNYSVGDKDILLMEVAYEKFRKDVYKTRLENKIPNSKRVSGFGTFENKYVEKGDFLSAGLPSDAIYIMTAKQAQIYADDENYEKYPILYIDSNYQMHLTDGNGQILEKTAYKSNEKSQMQGILDNLEKDYKDGKLDNFAVEACIKVSAQEVNGHVIKGGPHAFTIVGVDKDNVYLANPWSPEDKITMSKENFMASCYRLEATPLNKKGEEAFNNTVTSSNENAVSSGNTTISNKPNYTVKKGTSYTAMIKEALEKQRIQATPENIQKAKEQFEAANPSAVKIYRGKNKSWHGNKFLYANAKVFIPKFKMD